MWIRVGFRHLTSPICAYLTYGYLLPPDSTIDMAYVYEPALGGSGVGNW